MKSEVLKYRKLNIGCGSDIREGYMNLDAVAMPGVDIVHDITSLPLPFADNSFDEILCKQILEHLRCLPLLKELHRILAPGGKLIIETDHFTSKRNYIDLQHVQLFCVETFDMYVKGQKLYETHKWYIEFTFSRCTYRYIRFDHSNRIFFLNRFVEKWVNKSKRRQQIYESTGLSRLFPAEHLHITLVK